MAHDASFPWCAYFACGPANVIMHKIALMNKSVTHTKMQERLRRNKAMTITMMDEEVDGSTSDSILSVEVGLRLIDELDNEWECRCDSYEERQN